MSKKSRQRKWRRIESFKKQEQLALTKGSTMPNEKTIGELVNQLVANKSGISIPQMSTSQLPPLSWPTDLASLSSKL